MTSFEVWRSFSSWTFIRRFRRCTECFSLSATRTTLGWIGVDIFFVLSGFLVGGLLMKEWKVRGGIDAKRFLIRRAFKIWPQYYLYLAVLLVTRHDSVAQLSGNLLNIQNYTGGVAHTWSLAVEEHCYLLLLLGMVIASRQRISIRRLFFALLGLCLLETPVRFALVYTGHTIFLPTHARLDSIGYGVLLAILFHFAPERFERLRSHTWLWLLCFTAGLLALRGQYVPRYRFAAQHDAATLVAVSVLLLLYRPQPAGSKRTWAYRLVAWIGLYSYGIYLWHIAVIRPCVALLGRLPGTPVWLATVFLWSAAIALGVLTTKVCEAPALRLRDRLFPRRVASAVGLATPEPAATPTPVLSLQAGASPSI